VLTRFVGPIKHNYTIRWPLGAAFLIRLASFDCILEIQSGKGQNAWSAVEITK